MQPFFSVVIPLYNKEKHIKKTIKSVLNQEFKYFEIIVVNDGSTDDSLKKVEEIKDSRIIVYSIKNQGVSHARNYGIKKAKSDYICFLDADDFWYKNHLTEFNELLKNNPKCGLYATAYHRKINNIYIKSIYKNIPINKKWSGIVNNYFESSLVNGIAWTSTVMMPKHIFEEIGFFDENITFGAGEDTDMWLRVALRYPIAFSNEITGSYNLVADNRITNINPNKRAFINLDKYEAYTNDHKFLKKYLDIIRYSIGIQYKIVNNKKEAKKYFDKIDSKSLNTKQFILTKFNASILKFAIKVQNTLRKVNINLTAFR